MVTGDSPAGARRRVRLAIRDARDAMGYTQAQVAEEMEWSLSKVMRIESGEVTITPNDLRPLLGYLGVGDRAVVDDLVQDARTSRRRAQWWDDPKFREHLTPAMRLVLQYEAEATEFRHYHQNIVPGVLQSAEYARALLSRYDELPETTIEARVDARVRRGSQLVARLGQVVFLLLLDEAVLRRQVDPKIVGAELAGLLQLVRRGLITFRILHFGAAVPPPLYGSFELLTLPGDGTNNVLYRESYLMDEVIEDQASLIRHRGIFEELWAGALDEESSIAMLAETVDTLGGSPDTQSRTDPTPRRKSSTRRGKT